jgi:delta24-sterol reductase
MKFGLIPPVVPEFPGITVGGAFSGTAGESSSFRHGYFDKTVQSVEMILGNGEIVATTPDNKPDLFYGTAGAYGSLGVTTLFEIRLIPAEPYVELSYIPVTGAEDAIATITKAVGAEKEPFNFVDGILSTERSGVVCVGRMTEICTYTPQGFSHPQDPWFYMHTLKKAEAGTKENPLADTIPLEDYLFRYDRGAFWMGSYYPLFYFKFLNNRFTRWIFDSYLRTRFLFQSMHIISATGPKDS